MWRDVSTCLACDILACWLVEYAAFALLPWETMCIMCSLLQASLNSLPKGKILDQPNLKAFADDTVDATRK